jgi:hypothetical protein
MLKPYELFYACNLDEQVNAAPGHIALQLMTAEDRYKLVMSELLQWISAN